MHVTSVKTNRERKSALSIVTSHQRQRPYKCCVCKRNRASLTAAPVHKFPKDHLSQVLWCVNLNLNISSILPDAQSLGVCGRHFLPSCYQSVENLIDYRPLKHGAIPTLKDEAEWNKIFETTELLLWEDTIEDTAINYQKKSIPRHLTPWPSGEHNYTLLVKQEKSDEDAIPISTDSNDESEKNLKNMKFIVYGSPLVLLFQNCLNKDCSGIIERQKLKIHNLADELNIIWTCTNGHNGTWTKQLFLDSRNQTLQASSKSVRVSVDSAVKSCTKLADITKCIGLQFL